MTFGSPYFPKKFFEAFRKAVFQIILALLLNTFLMVSSFSSKALQTRQKPPANRVRNTSFSRNIMNTRRQEDKWIFQSTITSFLTLFSVFFKVNFKQIQHMNSNCEHVTWGEAMKSKSHLCNSYPYFCDIWKQALADDWNNEIKSGSKIYRTYVILSGHTIKTQVCS